MVLKADQLRVKALLTETITLLCKNGLNYRSEFAIEALIGITLDKDDVFLISIKEKINGGMGILDAGDDPAQKRDFDIDISAAGDSFAAAEPSPADKRENSDGSESDASNSGAAPRKLFKSGQRRRRRRSNDTQGNSQSGDSSAFALPDFDIEKALDDTENLPVASYTASADLCEEGRDNEPTDKKPRVDGEDLGETRVKEEEEDEDDDLIMVKEEAPSNIGSCAYQQSYPQTGQSMSGGMSSAPVFPGSSSWTAPLSMPPAGSASLSSPAHSAQHANNSMLHTPQQANTSMSQQGGTPQSAHMQQIRRADLGAGGGSSNRRTSISLQQKLDIIERVERGEVQVDVARKYGISRSAVTEIKKSKHRIRQFLDCIGTTSESLRMTSMHTTRAEKTDAVPTQYDSVHADQLDAMAVQYGSGLSSDQMSTLSSSAAAAAAAAAALCTGTQTFSSAPYMPDNSNQHESNDQDDL